MPAVWDFLGKVENKTIDVVERRIADAGLTQELPTMFAKYAPKFVEIVKELLRDDTSDKAKEKLIVPAVQTFVDFFNDLFVKRSGDPSLRG